MTRQEFEDICTMGELMDLCSDEGCWVCEDVYYEDSYNDAVNEELSDRARNDCWTDVRDWLSELPDGYNYYRRNYYGDWYGIDDYEFDDYNNQVEEWMDENDRWEDDEEEEVPYEDPFNAVPTEQEEISFDDLMASASDLAELARKSGATPEQVSEIEANFLESVSNLLTV